MKLSLKISLAFLLVALLPLAVVVLVYGSSVEVTLEESFSSRLMALGDALSRRVDAVATQITTDLTKLGDHEAMVYLDKDLSQGAFYGVQSKERALLKDAANLMAYSALDALTIVDTGLGGKVLAMGHKKGAIPPMTDAKAKALAGTTWVGTASIDGAQVPVLLAAAAVTDRITLVGGKRLDGAILTELGAGLDAATTIALLDGAGAPLVAGAGWPGEEPFEVLSVPLDGGGDATVVIHVSRSPLVQAKRNLYELALALSGGGILLALVVGLILSRTLTGTLRSLATAAGRLATGERKVELPRPKKDEVGDLIRAFDGMARDLTDYEEKFRNAERIAARRDLARKIAHEIKNPLMPIRTSIEALKRAYDRKLDVFDEIFTESTDVVLEEVDRIKRIVTEFSKFARMPEPSPEPCDLVALASSSVALHRPSAKDVSLVLESASPTIPVMADPTLLGQVFGNLVRNAIEAVASTGKEGTVVVRLFEEGTQAVAEIQDSGPGIKGEARDKIFTPYFTTKDGGTGLGLSIVHLIVTDHGGTVSFSDAPSGGALFRIRLPRRP